MQERSVQNELAGFGGHQQFLLSGLMSKQVQGFFRCHGLASAQENVGPPFVALECSGMAEH